MQTAQQMVDEATKAAGYTIKVHHGTTNMEEKTAGTAIPDPGILSIAESRYGVALTPREFVYGLDSAGGAFGDPLEIRLRCRPGMDGN